MHFKQESRMSNGVRMKRVLPRDYFQHMNFAVVAESYHNPASVGIFQLAKQRLK
jgi:hypothetical protein